MCVGMLAWYMFIRFSLSSFFRFSRNDETQDNPWDLSIGLREF